MADDTTRGSLPGMVSIGGGGGGGAPVNFPTAPSGAPVAPSASLPGVAVHVPAEMAPVSVHTPSPHSSTSGSLPGVATHEQAERPPPPLGPTPMHTAATHSSMASVSSLPGVFSRLALTTLASSPPQPLLPSASPRALGEAWRLPLPRTIDVSVILGTVNRPELLRECIDTIRASAAGYRFEIVVAYGDEAEPSLSWMCSQPDVIPVLGGREGAIVAFNRAYEASHGDLICQLNDDLLVDGDSVARAVRHLDDDPSCAAVVFRFDRRDGHGYRHECYDHPTKLHPNQMVARRSTCEAVIARIGAFWGDAAHRTDKTYGGDSAFGAICHHLGLRLDSVDGVTCRDRQNEVNDALRVANQQIDPGHGDQWRALYLPLLQTSAQPPDVATRIAALDPLEGRFPPRARAAAAERVLHVHLGLPSDPQAGLVRALQRFGSAGYAQVEWPSLPLGAVAGEILAAAERLRPTVVFLQLQTPDVVSPATIERLRALSDPRVVIATWCGDVAMHNSPWNVGWQVPLGRACDLTLHTSLTHVRALRAAGVAGAAYLQIGYDQAQYHPAPAGTAIEYDVAFLGSRYYNPDYLQTMREHDAGLRDDVVRVLDSAIGPRFGLFGSGQPRQAISLSVAHETYWRSRMGLNVSLCNFFEAYSSDRIFRILGCGVALLTKSFPLMSAYGLRHEENCLVWNTPAEAVELARDYARPERAGKLAAIAEAGGRLALERHTWDARVMELVPYLCAVRNERW